LFGFLDIEADAQLRVAPEWVQQQDKKQQETGIQDRSHRAQINSY
jgi:hypothetical protein